MARIKKFKSAMSEGILLTSLKKKMKNRVQKIIFMPLPSYCKKITDDYVAKIDIAVANKEKDLTTI